MTEKDLTPIEQKEVTFYDDELTAIRADDGQVYVSIRHMCDALGIQRPQRQTDRIKRDEVLNDGLQRVPIMGTRGRQKTFVLWEAFQEGRLTADPSFEALLKTDSPAVQAYKTFQALTKLARSQILIEAKLEDHELRLERIEATLGDTGKSVTPDQASQISQAVKAIALELGKTTKRNEYGAIYGEVYRREGITSYKLLPAHRFETVMKWLAEWYRQVTDKDLPF